MRRPVLPLLAFLFGCTRTLPPLPPPSTEPPRLAVDPGPIPPDKGRVVLDSVGAPARVYVEAAHVERREQVRIPVAIYVNGRYDRTETRTEEVGGEATTIRPLCKTPCAADLIPGTYTLHFEPDAIPDPSALTRDSATVAFGPTPTVYRRAVGTHPSLGASLGHGVVSTAWIGSALVWAGIGGGLLASSPSTDDQQRAAGAMLGLGAFVVVTGIVYAIVARPDSQDGAGVQFAAPR